MAFRKLLKKTNGLYLLLPKSFPLRCVFKMSGIFRRHTVCRLPLLFQKRANGNKLAYRSSQNRPLKNDCSGFATLRNSRDPRPILFGRSGNGGSVCASMFPLIHNSPYDLYKKKNSSNVSAIIFILDHSYNQKTCNEKKQYTRGG